MRSATAVNDPPEGGRGVRSGGAGWLDYERKRYAENPKPKRRSVRRWSAKNPENRAENRRRTSEKYLARTDEQIAADRARLRPDGMKRCRSCKRHLPLDSFYQARVRPDGLQPTCIECLQKKREGELLKRAQKHALELSLDPLTCAYCRTAEATSGDHIIPERDGGLDDELNLLPACKPCNSSKNATALGLWLPRRLAALSQPQEWARELVELLGRERVELQSDRARLHRQRAQQQRDAETLF